MERLQKGEQLMCEIFGEETVESYNHNLSAISPSFLNFLKGTFGDIYAETELDLKTKEIIVLSSLITQKDTKPQIKVHIKAAIKAGITPKEILALILHLVIYVGFPSTLNALNTAKEVFDELGIDIITEQ